MPAEHTMEEIETRVADALASFGVDRDGLGRHVTLEALDVDSLDVVEVCEILREEMGINVEARDFSEVKTYGDILDVIADRLQVS